MTQLLERIQKFNLDQLYNLLTYIHLIVYKHDNQQIKLSDEYKQKLYRIEQLLMEFMDGRDNIRILHQIKYEYDHLPPNPRELIDRAFKDEHIINRKLDDVSKNGFF